jgi:hypothetical protein
MSSASAAFVVVPCSITEANTSISRGVNSASFAPESGFLIAITSSSLPTQTGGAVPGGPRQ